MNAPNEIAPLDLPRSMKKSPRLLISVRNAAEAKAAIDGGCDILDIKDPSQGSLGMADVRDMAAIVQTARDICPEVVLSAALGEVADWSEKPPPVVPRGISYTKLGTAGLGAGSAWKSQWNQVRAEFSTSAAEKLAWIAVAYADAEAACGPSIGDVITAAIEEKCAGVLVDTYSKSGRSVFDWVTPAELKQLAERAEAEGLLFVLAGQLRTADLPQVAEVAPDIVAVRSAVCTAGDRKSSITPEAVMRFQNALENAYRDHSPTIEASGSAAINSK